MSEKIEIHTANAPTATGPYSQAIVAGDYIFVSGQIPMDPKTRTVPEGIEAQTKQVLKNLENILAEHDCTLDDVVRVGVILSDPSTFEKMNEVYSATFPKPFPARTTMTAHIQGLLIEVDAIAYKPAKK